MTEEKRSKGYCLIRDDSSRKREVGDSYGRRREIGDKDFYYLCMKCVTFTIHNRVMMDGDYMKCSICGTDRLKETFTQ